MVNFPLIKTAKNKTKFETENPKNQLRSEYFFT
jgi:hypothetical protein